MSTQNPVDHDNYFFLVGRYRSVRILFALIALALGIWISVSGYDDLGSLSITAGIAFITSGILLFTKLWKLGVPFFWAGAGFDWLGRGIHSEEKQFIPIIMGGTLVVSWGVLIIIALVKMCITHRQRSQTN
ncbi:MAG: hypothetical protein ABFD83_12015 [Armatimonadota bacterium]